MAKSTFQDCHAIYRQTRTLTRAHKLTLIGWLQEDVVQKPRAPQVRLKKEKKAAQEEGTQT